MSSDRPKSPSMTANINTNRGFFHGIKGYYRKRGGPQRIFSSQNIEHYKHAEEATITLDQLKDNLKAEYGSEARRKKKNINILAAAYEDIQKKWIKYVKNQKIRNKPITENGFVRELQQTWVFSEDRTKVMITELDAKGVAKTMLDSCAKIGECYTPQTDYATAKNTLTTSKQLKIEITLAYGKTLANRWAKHINNIAALSDVIHNLWQDYLIQEEKRHPENPLTQAGFSKFLQSPVISETRGGIITERDANGIAAAVFKSYQFEQKYHYAKAREVRVSLITIPERLLTLNDGAIDIINKICQGYVVQQMENGEPITGNGLKCYLEFLIVTDNLAELITEKFMGNLNTRKIIALETSLTRHSIETSILPNSKNENVIFHPDPVEVIVPPDNSEISHLVKQLSEVTEKYKDSKEDNDEQLQYLLIRALDIFEEAANTPLHDIVTINNLKETLNNTLCIAPVSGFYKRFEDTMTKLKDLSPSPRSEASESRPPGLR